MNIWHDLSNDRVKEEEFTAVIEITKGSKAKYELDKETGMIMLDRVLSTSMVYPANYGFIPKTLSDDGDPLDVLVLCSEPLISLSLVECKPIAVIKMIDGGENDEKIVAVAKSDKFYNKYSDINELPAHIFDEMVHFFKSYKALENKFCDITGVENSDSAKRYISEAIARYNSKYAK